MQEKIFYLHVGGHKTATTSLQYFFDQNKAALKDLGLYWPKQGQCVGLENSWGHHELAWALRRDDPKHIWRALAHEIAELSADTSVLVSSEDFSTFQDPRKFGIVRKTMGGFSIRPIYYMRRQDQLLESIYKYHVSALGEKQGIIDFSKRIFNRLSHAKLIDSLGKAFGRENLILRIYSRAEIRENIYMDFLSAIGLDGASGLQITDRAINQSLSDRGLSKMRQANRFLGRYDYILTNIRQKLLSRALAEPWTEHAILTGPERASIMRHFHEENRAIAREFFGREELFRS